jgi:predicted nucleic acid-binding protein
MKQVFIDTDIFVDFLRGQEKAKNIFEDIRNEKTIAFSSVITEAELLSGKECEDNEKCSVVEDVLSLISRIEINSAIAKIAGDFRRKYNVPLVDALIAATASKLAVPLYSRNALHYKKIKEIAWETPY